LRRLVAPKFYEVESLPPKLLSFSAITPPSFQALCRKPLFILAKAEKSPDNATLSFLEKE
jgi:hypothetical protein